MKRFLDILLVFSLSLLIFAMFFNKDNKKTPENVLEISFEKKSYTIPASVKVVVQNYTSSGVILDSCKDIAIFKSWERMTFDDDLCKEYEILPEKALAIDYSEDYELFDKVWRYTLEVNIDEKKYIDQFELKNKWIIKKTFVWLIYKPIYNIVVWLIQLFNGSFWWAIVGIAIILKIVLLYPQQKMMVSQRKIQDIQPKIKKIQEQYKDDQQKMGQELMALYWKEKVSPFGSCWFLLIQFPILIVVYNIIRSIQTPANEYYLYSFFNNFSISDINFDFLWLDLLAVWWIQWIILAISVAAIQFLQVKISFAWREKLENKKEIVLEKKENETDYSKMMPDMDMMNKFMMYGMPIMVWIFTYSWFAAIGLYWWLSTFFTIIQNLFVNKKMKK